MNENKKDLYYNATDIMKLLGISRASAYNLIRTLNEELQAKGYIVLRGKISRVYFAERWYGGVVEAAV